MKISTIAATGLLALAALTPAEANAQRGGEPYRATGTEPFWSATIGNAQMSFDPAEGPTVTVAKPRAIVGFNGERYQTRRLTIDITHVECSDGMSDRTYKDTVTVTTGRRTFRGCGGPVLSDGPGTTIVTGDWRVLTIAGRPPVRGTEVSVNFRGARVSGSTGCNSFSGPYRFDRGQVTAGPLITTKRACIGRAGNAQEQAVLRILGQRMQASAMRNGRLVLRAQTGGALVLAPVRGHH